MEKILVICGPTGVGKTKVALSLARKFSGQLISADSRQVYKGLDIGTGKEIPKGFKIQDLGFKNIPYYTNGNIKVWGYDLVGPREEFSVVAFAEFAWNVIRRVWREGDLPILVGGTGFYIDAVINGLGTFGISKNDKLREILEKFTPADLYEKLAQLDPIKAGGMNASDKKNPRRLIRAIEVAQAKLSGKQNTSIRYINKKAVLFVGIKAGKEKQKKLIERRITERVKMGQEEEIGKLLDKGVDWSDQAMSSIGYREWQGYFLGEKSKSEVIREWTTDEIRYAKRQMVWFKRDKNIVWFDSARVDFQKNIENVVQKWYSRKYGEES